MGQKVFQSTLPQGERQNSFFSGKFVGKISIHAPTRGATEHTQQLVSLLYDFNPRSHKGSDQVRLLCKLFYKGISIHAPTRGATSVRLILSNTPLYFNPRSHKGSDFI